MLRHALLTFFILVGLAAPLSAAEPAAAAVVEIEHLLIYVKGLDGARFVRNGSDYPPAQAEQHLRMKWEKQRAKIASAEAFVELCATRSSMSGELYQIRMPDGDTEPAGKLLLKELERFRGAATQAKP